MHKIGIDLSVTDRVKTGTSVYAINLFEALSHLPDEFEIIELRTLKPLRRKNILTKFGNLFIELAWLFVILPFRAWRLRLELVHFPANIISPVLRLPQVCTIHDAHFMTNPQGRDPLWRLYAKFSFRFAARRAKRIICDSNSGKAEVIEVLGARSNNITVIPLGLPRRQTSPLASSTAARLKPYILSVGATDPNKNLSALIKAYSQLVQEDRHYGHKLVLAGPPGRDQEILESLVFQKNLSHDVKLLGQVSDSLLAALYENASIFVFPSFCEGFGFPPLEAMSYGVPVTASNAPCIPETLGEAAALFFDPHCIDEIAERMYELMSNSRLRKKLAKAGSSRAAEFTWQETAKKTMDVYREVLG